MFEGDRGLIMIVLSEFVAFPEVTKVEVVFTEKENAIPEPQPTIFRYLLTRE